MEVKETPSRPAAVLEMESVRERLKQLRLDARTSQAVFAESLGLPARTYQAYEGGERDVPLDVVNALYVLRGVSPLWLLYGQGGQTVLTIDSAISLCADLYATWEKAIDELPVNVSLAVRKAFHRKLARSTFTQGRVPLDELTEILGDLTP